jgi:hypothetical protein
MPIIARLVVVNSWQDCIGDIPHGLPFGRMKMVLYMAHGDHGIDVDCCMSMLDSYVSLSSHIRRPPLHHPYAL